MICKNCGHEIIATKGKTCYHIERSKRIIVTGERAIYRLGSFLKKCLNCKCETPEPKEAEG